MNQLEILQRVDFDWVVRLDDVWSDDLGDVPDLQSAIRKEFITRMRHLLGRSQTGSPLGWVVVGPGGSGKTHLLNAFRRKAVENDTAFVLVDMTDVRDFWDTVLQGYLDSLQMPYRDGEYQYRCLLHGFLERLPRKQTSGHVMSLLAQRKSRQLAGDINRLLTTLAGMHRKETFKYQDIVRAIVCLNSDDFGISNLGMTWLQGQEIDEQTQRLYNFHKTSEQPSFIVEALSWLMSLAGPTILAFDQLDPLVQQLKYRSQAEAELDDDEARSLSILLEVAGGLMALVDVTRRTQIILSCIESTWNKLAGLAMSTVAARFDRPETIRTSTVSESIELLVGDRLARAFSDLGYHPEYPTWPFRSEAFRDLLDDTPREVLQKCDHHRRKCIEAGKVTELASFRAEPSVAEQEKQDQSDWSRYDTTFQDLCSQVDADYLLEERFEDDRIAPLLCHGLKCFLVENPTSSAVDAILETNFPGGKKSVPLHARLRYVMHDRDGREDHYCVRALQHTNATAFQARLNAAMTLSGIDPALPYRHLAIIRTNEVPRGPVSQKLTKKFLEAGGKFVAPANDELGILFALNEINREQRSDFEAWLRARRHASRLTVLQEILFQESAAAPEAERSVKESQSTDPGPKEKPPITPTAPPKPATPPPGSKNEGGATAQPVDSPSSSDATLPAAVSVDVPIGNRLVAGQAHGPLEVPVAGLEKHTVVLAGAGSGKTVLLRRLIEEVAIRGIPSIVIDCANDLATFDERWPGSPSHWLPDDANRADTFFARSEMVLWTPGRDDGNPLTLQPIPDLAAVADNPQELTTAVDMVSESLRQTIAPGKTAKARNKHGILVTSLKYFARLGGGNLDGYIDLLTDLPLEAGPGVNSEQKLAKEMADCLRVEKETNALLRTSGVDLDPAILFGDDKPSGRARISVINFVGLTSLEQQRHFLNQLAMLLFSWIKKNPNPPGRPLRGLLVIDEARDFVPSQKASVCKDSLLQLTAQARKYHLGMVFATQNPKDLESKIIGNCSTQVYGKANAPASIDVIREQIRLKGGSGDDVPQLKAGQFYAYNADLDLRAPVKVRVPLCLSCHRTNPLDPTEVLEKAARSQVKCRGSNEE